MESQGKTVEAQKSGEKINLRGTEGKSKPPHGNGAPENAALAAGVHPGQEKRATIPDSRQMPDREEDFHFLWEHLHFDRQELVTTDGHQVRILHPGTHNRNQGPDFLDAKIEMDGLVFHGHVELHLHSGEWYRHGHHLDPHYNNVILHVVIATGPRPPRRVDGTAIPELDLSPRIDRGILANIRQLRGFGGEVPCAPWLGSALDRLPAEMRESLGMERLVRRAERMRGRFRDLTGDWEQVLWEELAAMLGGPVNRESFRELARALPWRVVRKYAQPLGRGAGYPEPCGESANMAADSGGWPAAGIPGGYTQQWLPPATAGNPDGGEVPPDLDAFDRLALEALLFGVAGMLEDSPKIREAWPLRLRLEWAYLSQKHSLKSVQVPFLYHRMRPGAFPTVRLSQLAELVYRFPDLAGLLDPDEWGHFRALPVEAGRYWRSHLKFGLKKIARPRRLGLGFKDLVIANTLAPLALLYSQYHGNAAGGDLGPGRGDADDSAAGQVAVALRGLPPEDNRVLRQFSIHGERPRNALEAQGLMELQQSYCSQGRCLECRFGKDIVTGRAAAPAPARPVLGG